MDDESKENEMKLRGVLPQEFFAEFMDTPAAGLLDEDVISEVDGTVVGWPGKHKNVYMWWKLANGKAVGWNENPGVGWSFPVTTYRRST